MCPPGEDKTFLKRFDATSFLLCFYYFKFCFVLSSNDVDDDDDDEIEGKRNKSFKVKPEGLKEV